MSTDKNTYETEGLSRRDLLQAAGAATLAIGAGVSALGSKSTLAASTQKNVHPKGVASAKPYNILFILTDQERYFLPGELPAGYSLPGRERLAREGVTFTNHQIASCVCTSSRSVIYTGQHMPNTGLFDNMGFPWQQSLSTEIPTIGDQMRGLGYHSAYLGKWHMSQELEEIETGEVPGADLEALNALMNEHGFSDYFGVGDIIGTTLGGYRTDEFTASTAVRWLRAKAQTINAQGQPWYLAVNLVNPHDVMYLNTDATGEKGQMTPKPLMKINRSPAHELYQQHWGMKLAVSRHQPWNLPGRPEAHRNYQYAMGQLVGQIPNEDARWRRQNDYYLSCIKDSDSHIERLLREVDDLGLTDDTIVVMTSDHGELGGAHGMSGKGATAFREQTHVPLLIRHPSPDVPRGKACRAVTSHVDLTPTLISMAQTGGKKATASLPGEDFSALLKSPANADIDAVRDGALYCFNMWLLLDPDYLGKIADYIRANGTQGVSAYVKNEGLKPDLDRKRGAIRSVYDGRYRFSRYFPNTKHNLPLTLEDLFSINDVECYDLEKDPHEMNNLAVDHKKNGDLMIAMNSKLTALIEAEIGEDSGQMFPGERDWAVTKFNA
jgi:arylsulfatase